MPTRLFFLGRVGSIALIIPFLFSACVTSPTPRPTDNSATMTAKAASPTPVTPSPTVAPPTDTPAPTATPDPCSALNLTPEECANQGTHQYSITYEEMNGCESLGVDGVKEWTVSFSPTSYRGTRQGPNSWLWVNPDHPEMTTISTFSLDGFVEEIFMDGVLGEVSYEMVLCVRTTYELIR